MPVETEHSIKYFPVNLFGATMGLAGFSLASDAVSKIWGIDSWMHLSLSVFALLAYLMVLGVYGLKFLKYPQAVKDEWAHPVKISFFPAASISLLLLGGAFYAINQHISLGLWAAGTLAQFILSFSVINSWIKRECFKPEDASPAWFIPVAGNIIVPVAGVAHGYVELSWFFFAWGLLFWFILLVMIFNRLVFHQPMPGPLFPTLFIMLTPPSIGFVSYIQLVGELDIFGRLMYYWAMIFFFLMLAQMRQFMRLNFTLSWWAYSFPTTAFTGATALMGELTGAPLFEPLAQVLFVATLLIIVFLIVRTVMCMFRQEICVPG